MFGTSESLLEPLARQFRFGIANDFLIKNLSKDSVILDFGCGPKAKFFDYLANNSIPFKKYYGFDPLIKGRTSSSYKITTHQLKDILNYKYDLVVMFAVLEHLEYPIFDYSFLKRVLKSNTWLLITSPTKIAKPVLDFLAFRLRIISRREIEEHKHYYTTNEIVELFGREGLTLMEQRYFDLWMNNYLVFRIK